VKVRHDEGVTNPSALSRAQVPVPLALEDHAVRASYAILEIQGG